jgi:hypothetical protein
MVCFQLCIGPEFTCDLLCDLHEGNPVSEDKANSRSSTYQSLWLFYMLVTKQKLAIEIAQVDGVEIDDVYFAEAGEHEVLEQLAADSASANQEHARLPEPFN